MTVMKVCVSLPPHTCIDIGSGGGQTPWWAWAPFIVVYHCPPCHLFLFSYILRTLIFPSSFFISNSSSISLCLWSNFLLICSPPPPLSVLTTPPSLCLAGYVFSVALGSCQTWPTAQHPSPGDVSQNKKKARHAGRPPPLQPVTPKPAHTLTVAKGGEVKKMGEEHRERWAADLYAFIRARPWSWMPLRELDGSLHPHARRTWAHWLHIESVHVQTESCRDIKKRKRRKDPLNL